MPVEANAKIVIKGGPESLKVLQGIKRESNEAAREMKKALQEQEKAQRAAAKSAEASAKAQQKAARDTARAQERASRDASRVQQKASSEASRAQQKAQADAVRAAQKAQREIERAAQKQADYWQRAAQKSSDARIRAEERATLAARREAGKQEAIARKSAETQAKDRRDALRRAGGLVGAGAAGLLAGAAVAGSTARGIAGVKDVRERITSANEFRERLVLTAASAGLTPEEREGVQGKVLSTSMTTGKDIGELLGVLETGQAQFNNLRFFADNLMEIGTIAKTANSDTGEFATALGFVQQAFGLTGEEAMEAAYLMQASADKGSVEMKDFARDFAASAGIFAMNTGQKGLPGVRQFLGTSQGIATGGFGSAESSTRLERFITDLNDVDVQKGLKKIGIKTVADKNGKIDVGSVVEQLSTNAKFKKASVRQEIFKDVRGQQAIEALVAARGRVQAGVAGAVDLQSISRVDAAAGREAVTGRMDTLKGEGFFKMQQEAARMQADTVRNLESYNAQVLLAAEAADRLETAFGSLSLWANSIAAGGAVSAGVGMLGKAANAGSSGGKLAKALPTVANAGAAIAGGAGTALAAGSTALAAASGAAIAGTVGAGLAIGGAIGYGANELTSAVRSDDKSLSDLLADALFEAMNKTDARFKEGSRIENTNDDGTKRLITVMEANNRKLESIDMGLRATTQKPPAGAPREPR